MLRWFIGGVALSLTPLTAQELPESSLKTLQTQAFSISGDDIAGVIFVSEVCRRVEAQLVQYFNPIRGQPQPVAVMLHPVGTLPRDLVYRARVALSGRVYVDIEWSRQLAEWQLWQAAVEGWLLRWHVWYYGPTQKTIPIWLVEGLTYELAARAARSHPAYGAALASRDPGQDWRELESLMIRLESDFTLNGLCWEFLREHASGAQELRFLTNQIISGAPPAWALRESLGFENEPSELNRQWLLHWHSHWLGRPAAPINQDLERARLVEWAEVTVEIAGEERRKSLLEMEREDLSPQLEDQLQSRLRQLNTLLLDSEIAHRGYLKVLAAAYSGLLMDEPEAVRVSQALALEEALSELVAD